METFIFYRYLSFFFINLSKQNQHSFLFLLLVMNINVSKLDRSTSVEELTGLFKEFGDVEEVVLGEAPDPGKDTFSAIVTMTYRSDAEEAIEQLDGERIDGRFISVRMATDKENQQSQQTLEDDEAWDDWEETSNDAPWQPIIRKRPPKEGGQSAPKGKRRRRPKR